LGILEEQKETIKVENFLVYSPHSIPVHDSLPDDCLRILKRIYLDMRTFGITFL
jgi:hypothetical protein